VGKSIGHPMREKLTLSRHAGVAIRSATRTRTHELWAGLRVKQTPSRNSARSLTALYNVNIGNRAPALLWQRLAFQGMSQSVTHKRTCRRQIAAYFSLTLQSARG
jgi:hypothetical protein